MGKNNIHSNKEIAEALKHAKSKGWKITKSKKGHAWGNIKCPYNNKECRCGMFCRISIWSTPKSPHNHARMIKDRVDSCIKDT